MIIEELKPLFLFKATVKAPIFPLNKSSGNYSNSGWI